MGRIEKRKEGKRKKAWKHRGDVLRCPRYLRCFWGRGALGEKPKKTRGCAGQENLEEQQDLETLRSVFAGPRRKIKKSKK